MKSSITLSRLLTVLLCLSAFILSASADKPKPAPAPRETSEAEATDEEIRQAAAAMEKKYKFQQGRVTLKNDLATLDIPKGFRYLDGTQASQLLEDWGNPPDRQTLGMILPADAPLIGEASWGVIITYEEEGYVKDDEASSLNYDEILQQMKEGVAEENQERAKAGFEKIEIVGWATRPHYDQSGHKLYWAKEIKFGDESENTLNYNIRVLGRRGVLVLNAVASMKQLPSVEKSMSDVLGFVAFNEGNRYTDFKPGTDKIAAYGIGALIAGKLAAKAGFFKILLGLLVAGKKFVVVALIGLGALLKKLFSRKSTEETSA